MGHGNHGGLDRLRQRFTFALCPSNRFLHVSLPLRTVEDLLHLLPDPLVQLAGGEEPFVDEDLPEVPLPVAIRTDNGVPFASPNALFNLSKLAVWWLRLGVAIERIKPGHPQQNGRHERMHLTLKKETTRPAGLNSLQQQGKFDAFIQEFNTERPHEALSMKCPAEVYTRSPRPYDGLPELGYPFHDRSILVTACGRICLHRKRINISTVLAGQTLGIKEIDEGIWLVSFMHYDLGYFDLEQKTLQPLDNPFGPRLSPMS